MRRRRRRPSRAVSERRGNISAGRARAASSSSFALVRDATAVLGARGVRRALPPVEPSVRATVGTLFPGWEREGEPCGTESESHPGHSLPGLGTRESPAESRVRATLGTPPSLGWEQERARVRSVRETALSSRLARTRRRERRERARLHSREHDGATTATPRSQDETTTRAERRRGETTPTAPAAARRARPLHPVTTTAVGSEECGGSAWRAASRDQREKRATTFTTTTTVAAGTVRSLSRRDRAATRRMNAHGRRRRARGGARGWAAGGGVHGGSARARR